MVLVSAKKVYKKNFMLVYLLGRLPNLVRFTVFTEELRVQIFKINDILHKVVRGVTGAFQNSSNSIMLFKLQTTLPVVLIRILLFAGRCFRVPFPSSTKQNTIKDR